MKHQRTQRETPEKQAATGTAYKPRKFLGEIAELGTAVFTVHHPDSPEAYLLAVERVSAYVGREYSKKMQVLVENQKEHVFVEPVEPSRTTSTAAELKRYEVELAELIREQKKYCEHKTGVFLVLLGQCTHEVKVCLKNDASFAEIKDKDDVLGLLKLLRTFAYVTDGSQHPYLAVCVTEKRLLSITQGRNERTSRYVHRFKTLLQVVEERKGPIYPKNLIVTDGDTELGETEVATAREQYLSMLLLLGADRGRYGTLLDNLHNSYISKHDLYPKTIDETFHLLSTYQAPKQGINKADKDALNGLSFAQKHKGTSKNGGVKCSNCGKFGHYADQCSLSDNEAASPSNLNNNSSERGDDRSSPPHWSRRS